MNNHQRIGWVKSCGILIFLTSRVDAAYYAPSSRSYRVSREILEGLQSSSSAKSVAADASNNAAPSHLLDLETDFYDASTGLYSEGVWHNCMAGIAALRLSRADQRRDRHRCDDAARIADSLFRYSWDGASFRRRAWSGNWDHSRLQPADTDVVQPNYYKESSEHRCIQHAIALVFWSILAQDDNSNSNANSDVMNIRSQQLLISKKFVDEFWNGRRWTTISRVQGSGTTLRPSASSGATTDTSSSEAPYFRAVDQAVAVLACLQHIELLDTVENENEIVNRDDERERMVLIIQTTCKDLLNGEDGFGYENLPNARTYLGLHRNPNFWHEGYVMLALTLARDYIWPMDAQEGHLRILWNGLMERYTTSAGSIKRDTDDAGTTIWHWPLSQKDAKSNVRYCGDNALAHAILRNLQFRSNTSEQNDEADGEDDAFWSFVEMLRSENKGDDDSYHHLASVADVYPQVRLHPNTELAALLVWPP